MSAASPCARSCAQPAARAANARRGVGIDPDIALLFRAKVGLKNMIPGNKNPFLSNVIGPQYVLQADGSYANAGAVAPVDVIGGRRMLRTCGAVTNLFSGDTSAARSVTLTARSYTLQVFGAGSASCSYGTATVGNPLKFTATAGATTFTPTGATLWMLTASAYPLPYTPHGTTMPASHATTTNGPWFGLPQYDDAPANTKVNKVWAALTGSPMTLAWRGVMGVGSGDCLTGAGDRGLLAVKNTATDILFYNTGTVEPLHIVRTTDGSNYPSSGAAVTWTRQQGVIAFVQVSSSGLQYRCGRYIIGVSSAINWGAWSTYDGSFNLAGYYKLMLGFINTHPLWHDTIALWNKQIDDATLLKEMLK